MFVNKYIYIYIYIYIYTVYIYIINFFFAFIFLHLFIFAFKLCFNNTNKIPSIKVSMLVFSTGSNQAVYCMWAPCASYPAEYIPISLLFQLWEKEVTVDLLYSLQCITSFSTMYLIYSQLDRTCIFNVVQSRHQTAQYQSEAVFCTGRFCPYCDVQQG